MMSQSEIVCPFSQLWYNNCSYPTVKLFWWIQKQRSRIIRTAKLSSVSTEMCVQPILDKIIIFDSPVKINMNSKRT